MAHPVDVPPQELLGDAELAPFPRHADADVRGVRVEDGLAVAVVRPGLVHHRFLRAAHHVEQGAVAEAEVRGPGGGVLAQAVVATGERVAHVRRLPVEGEVAAGAVADLQPGVGVGDGGGVGVELHRTQAGPLPVAIDHPQQLGAERHARLVGGTVSLREGRAEGQQRGEKSQKQLLHGT